MQQIVGDDARWSDTEHLLAVIADSAVYHNWLYAVGTHGPDGKQIFQGAPKKPPRPIRRPGELETAPGVTATRNVSERMQVTAGSLSLAELDAAVERQTGARRGVIDVEEV